MLMDKQAFEREGVRGHFVLLGHVNCSKRWLTKQDTLSHRRNLQVSVALVRRGTARVFRQPQILVLQNRLQSAD